MTPLPDRTVLLLLLVTVATVFALVFWSARLQPHREPPLLWRQANPADLRL
ncbi:MAG: hypothetical protein VKN13_05230 [Cyanobacteriota bacterium]|nr:hypothetical protein [Cyanobacteriota bacterium]